MISETALIDADYLIERGVKLTPNEVLRLNDLGCAVEMAGTEYDSPANARRFVRIGEALALEPSISSASWLSDAMAFYKPETMLDLFLVRFLVFLVPAKDLPDLQDGEGVKEIIRAKVYPVIKSLTYRQCYLIAAYLSRWTDDGIDVKGTAGEEDGKNVQGRNVERLNPSLGLMIQAKIYGLDFSMDDYGKMTATQLFSAFRRYRLMNKEKFGPEKMDSEKIAYDKYFDELEGRVKNGDGQH